jgi:hypothetical protein
MSVFNQKASTQKEFDLAPAGSHAACLIAIIDLGTHRETFQGQDPRDNRKVFLAWEIDNDGENGRTVIGREYNVSFTSKSALRIMVEKWRGKQFGEDEEFDLTKLLGKACLLTVTHSTNGDRTFAKIDGVAPMPKGMAALKPSRTPVSFDADSGATFPDAEWLPWTFGKKLVDKFNARLEMMGKGNSVPAAAGASASNDDFEQF